MRSLVFILIGLCLLLMGGRLVQHGMFIDGLTYVSIARNMAEGLGSFWKPFYSEALYEQFYEHPPLALWLESLLFRLFGDHFWVERLFCALTVVGTIGLIRQIWQQLFSAATDLQAWWPFAAILWVLNEDVYLSYPGNMLECTMNLFCMGAVALLLARGTQYRALAGAGLLLLAALLCKGPGALYPLAFFFFYRLAFREKSARAWWHSSFLLLATSLFCFAALWMYAPARHFLEQYFSRQVLASLAGQRSETPVDSRFFIAERVFNTNLPGIIPALVAWGIYAWRYRLRFSAPVQSAAIFCFGTGISAFLPIMLSVRQSAHYAVPSAPWIAMACAALIVPLLELWRRKIRSPQWLKWLPAFATACLLFWNITQFGNIPSRFKRDLGDLFVIAPHIPPRAHVGIHMQENEYALMALYQRYGRHYLRTPESWQDYIIVARNHTLPADFQGKYIKKELKTSDWDLYLKAATATPTH